MNLELSREKIKATYEVSQNFMGDGKFSGSCVKIKVGEDKQGVIQATNGDYGFQGNFAIEKADGVGDFLLPMEKFMNLLKDLPQNKFSLSLTDNKIVIKGKKFKYSLPKNESTFLYLETEGLLNSFSINSQKLSKIFGKVLGFASKDNGDRKLHSVYLNVDLHETDIVSTDGRKMAYKVLDTKANINTKNKSNILLPLPTIKNMIPLLTNDTGTVTVEVYKSLIKFVFENKFEVVSRQIDDAYAPYKKVAHINMNEHEIVVGKNSLASALKRILTVSSNHICDFNFTEKELILSGSLSGEGEGSEEIEIINKSKILGERSYNIYYVLDALKAIETDEVLIRITNIKKPLAFKEYHGDDNIVFVIMPVRKQ